MDGCSFVEWAIKATYDGDRCPECNEEMRQLCQYITKATLHEYGKLGWLCHLVSKMADLMPVDGAAEFKAETKRKNAQAMARAKSNSMNL